MTDPQTENSTDSRPRPRRHFSLDDTQAESAKLQGSETEDTLRSTQRFDAQTAHQPLEPIPADHKALPEETLYPPRKRRWGLIFSLAGVVGLGSAELVTGIPVAFEQARWLDAAWQLFALGLIGFGGLALLREVARLKRLKHHDRLRETLAELPQRSSRQAMQQADALRRQLTLSDDDPHWQAFQHASQPHHSSADIMTLLDYHLLAPRDREAQRLISRMSGETAIMVAVSPLTLVDMALVAWRSLAMINRLCRLYGLELSFISRLRLFRSVLYQMAFAGASELATDAGMDMLSLDVAGRISARASQGLATGLLSARLGLRAQRLCRPLAFTPEQQPRMTDLRQDLWRQIRRLDTQRSTQPED